MNEDTIVFGGQQLQVLGIRTAIGRLQNVNLLLSVFRQYLTFRGLSRFDKLTSLHQAQILASLQDSRKSGRAFGIIRIPQAFVFCHAPIKHETSFTPHHFVRIERSLIYVPYEVVVGLILR